MKNPYEVLGVSENASEDEIKKTYKELARKWHPDLHQGDKTAEEKFKEINSAYEMVKDGKKPNSGMNPEDIFNSFFGGHNPFHRQNIKEGNISISFEEALNGCSKNIEIKNEKKCNVCMGIGLKLKNEICKKCGGRGQTVTQMGAIQFATSCNVCRGTGKEVESVCNNCNGKGKIINIDVLKVSVPPGTKYGTILSPQSNLRLRVLYKEHPEFSLSNNLVDIFSKSSISIFDAILGNDIVVNTLFGRKKVKIPAGIQPKTSLRIKGAGFHISSGPQGDHIVEVNVDIPKEINEEQKELFVKLKDLFNQGVSNG